MAAFGLLVWRVTGNAPQGLKQQFSQEQAERDLARARELIRIQP